MQTKRKMTIIPNDITSPMICFDLDVVQRSNGTSRFYNKRFYNKRFYNKSKRE